MKTAKRSRSVPGLVESTGVGGFRIGRPRNHREAVVIVVVIVVRTSPWIVAAFGSAGAVAKALRWAL